MGTTTDDLIDQLKEKFAVETDADLARKLRVDKSTVSSWRRRDGLPARFQKILEVGLSAQSVQAPPLEWGEEEKKAFSLALFRYCRLYADIVKRGEFRDLANLFPGGMGAFWVLMSQAHRDLISRQGSGQHSLDTALSLCIYDDLEYGSGAIERDLSLVPSHMRPAQAADDRPSDKK
ncbi:MAG: Mu family bacteriophage transcriptional repressor CI [Roseibaca calidilacus]|uniref:Mu family bacteriophage transcriptional repressor CI n=1 Tax=Roseibaca calidilacus TaxID=1666912 RepID=A0A0P7WGJ6_9RHOB|nr:helix-turn-helix domain-containing protein [Roseibaca calidilacus]KPP89495.1 MAG: Mu family bacteriophage transcriptional repressor CI [Roseibaca calidilacus]CUX79373.1 hypothetical protein Ga0058931_0051 [Roseibaca calidilacus]